MGPPRAKKQKRAIVLNSDEESADIESMNGSRHGTGLGSTKGKDKSMKRFIDHKLPARALPNPRSGVRKSDSASSRGSTPASASRKPKATASSAAKFGTLYTFFNSATHNQGVSPKLRTEDNLSCIEEADAIQEVDSHTECMASFQSRSQSQSDVQIVSNQSERSWKERPESSICQNKLVVGSQKFKPLGGTVRPVIPGGFPNLAEGIAPWAEMFGPSSIEELAVHKRKVTDVKNWLDNVGKGPEPKRVLILKGPSGTGKTATVAAIAKTLNLEIVEWKNPAASDFASDGFRSLSAQFDEFLERSGKFNGLSLKASGSGRNELQLQQPYLHSQVKDQVNRKRVILLEEFPNTFSRTSSALLSFRSNILRYLVVNTPALRSFLIKQQNFQSDVTPLIMIISETLLTTTTAAADSFTAHRVFGSDILNHPGTSVIEFNPIAPTILINALDRVIQKEARLSGRRRTPGPAVLKKLAEVGDIRSAIGSLEFMCLRGDDGGNWSGRVATKGKKRTKDASDLTRMEKESVEMVTQREVSLSVFHAVGKVIYNKRDETSASDAYTELPQQPPDHLSHHFRRLRSLVNVDVLMDGAGTDTSTFIAALHENYVLSCVGPTSMDSLNGCIDALSDSEFLGTDRCSGFGIREGSSNRIYQGLDAESLRQNEICFQVAVRGILFALPHPVKRHQVQSAAGGRHDNKGDVFKMFYPTSMRLWKAIEEIEGLLDRWTDPSTYMSGSPLPTNVQSARGIRNQKFNSSSKTTYKSSLPNSGDQALSPLLFGGNSARTEMILEKLPYVAMIERRRAETSRKCELGKITQFDGISVSTNEALDDEENDTITITAAREWATDVSAEPEPGNSFFERNKINIAALKNSPSLDTGNSGRGDLERLVLSDDDIEDD
ncbi:Cell cycle checkpoint protein rad17 [Xylographa opegraphella]|nr:Cell cycle checkpoint protein rad17 [Xylographa opegraphella]